MTIFVTLFLTGCSGFKFESSTLIDGIVGQEYIGTIANENEEIYYELDYDSVLPEGLILGINGSLTGTPKTSGIYTFLVVASIGEEYKEAVFTLNIEKGVIEYSGKELATGMSGQPYLQNIGTATGAESITYSLKEGSVLPDGLTLDEEGNISGIPAEAAVLDVTFVATANECEQAEANFTIEVVKGETGPTDLGEIVFEGWELTAAEVGTEYNESINKAYGVPNITYTIEYVNGVAFPKGLAFNELGFIYGTPEDSTSGIMEFKIKASAEGYESVTVSCFLRVYDKYIETNTFEAEQIDVSKLQGAGYSSSPSGRGMLQKFTNASNGYALGYLHKAILFDFYIESEADTIGNMILCLGTEVGTITFTPENFKIYINDIEIDYDSIEVVENGTGQTTVFSEFSLSDTIELKEGENKISFEILNTSEKAEIGTATAKGPIFDYLKIEGTDVKLGWRPVAANTN